MVVETREGRLASTFVTLADTLVADYDVVELLQTLVDACSELLNASAAGILVADVTGSLEVIASTSEESRIVDLMQQRVGRGPSVQCFATGTAVAVPDISTLGDEWAEFRAASEEQGFRSVHVVPLRLRGSVIGTLSLFRVDAGRMSEEDRSVAQGLADVATIGILHERALRESDIAQEQLQSALNSRVLIEQAKGVVSHTKQVGMGEAFNILRAYARSNNLGLRETSERVVNRSIYL
jgi:GAF domain-containing protein